MSFYTALTGLNGSQADISATSNNIANVATTGYKRSKAEFGDIFATSPLQNASSSIGSGTILKGIKQQFTCLLYTSPSPRDGRISRMPSSA